MFRLGILWFLPLVFLGEDDNNALRVELFGINPSQLLNRLVALFLETLRNLGPGTLILQGSKRIQENVFTL